MSLVAAHKGTSRAFPSGSRARYLLLELVHPPVPGVGNALSSTLASAVTNRRDSQHPFNRSSLINPQYRRYIIRYPGCCGLVVLAFVVIVACLGSKI